MKKIFTILAAGALAVPAMNAQLGNYVSIGTPEEIATVNVENKLTDDSDLMMAMGVFTIEGGQSFKIWNINYKGDATGYGPGVEGEIATVTADSPFTSNAVAGEESGYWTLAGEGSFEVKISYSFIEPRRITVSLYRGADDDLPTATFNFQGVENAYQYVMYGIEEMYRAISDNPLSLKVPEAGNNGTYQYDFAIIGDYIETYAIESITTNGPADAYNIESKNGVWTVSLNSSAKGLEFDVELVVLEEPVEYNQVYLGIADNGKYPSVPNEDYVFERVNDFTWSISVTLEPGQAVNIWKPTQVSLETTLEPYGPVSEEDASLLFDADNLVMYFNGVISDTDCWVLENEEPCDVLIVVEQADIADQILVTFDCQNEFSAISSINTNNGAEVIYNLQGVRVDRSNLVKGGIYIINGKKVAVK